MKALILGMSGTGTSYFASLLSALGWSDAPPTFSLARYGYETHESLVGRAVNRIALGGEGRSWPVERWHAYFHPRNQIDDTECHEFAQNFVTMNDSTPGDWYFKNPESLIMFPSIWNRFEWDYVIGVYRHPKESVLRMHSGQREHRRKLSWIRWMEEIVSCSTVVVRFPDDADRLCDALGVDMPSGFRLAKGRPRTRIAEEPEPWADQTWALLESVRWQREIVGA